LNDEPGSINLFHKSTKIKQEIKMKLKVFFAVTALSVSMLGSVAHADPVQLRVATYDPPGTPFVNMLNDWATSVTNDSKGTLKVNVFAGGSLGANPTQQVKLLLDGVADVVWAIPSYTPGRFPDVEVVEMPLLARNGAESTAALMSMYAKGQLKGFEEVKPLMLATTNQFGLHTTFPIRTLDDLKNKKIRVPAGNVATVMELVGATGVQIPATKVAESVARNVVDGFVGEWNFVGIFKLDQVTTHHLDVPLGAVAQMIAMTKRRYESLPNDARQAIDKHSGEAFLKKYLAVSVTGADATRDAVSKRVPGSVTQLNDDLQGKLKKSTQPVIDKWVAQRPENRVLLEQYRREISQQNPAR
jgi:TRAP-type C4-dicarboxylate transport system substrate-binding protein